MKLFIHIIISAFCIISITGCKKLIDVPSPSTQLDASTVFETDASAQSALAGIYSKMMSGDFGLFSGGETFFTGLSSDELINQSDNADWLEFSRSNLTPSNNDIRQLWSNAYAIIYAANAAWEGLNFSTTLSTPIKTQLKGEALFIRAFVHFYLVNLFGPIPYIDTTDYHINTAAGRLPVNDVYVHIVTDLVAAKPLLAMQPPSSGRTRPSSAAATALLARIYLYTGDHARAIEESTSLINDATYDLENLEDVFLSTGKEAIWQMLPVLPQRNTNEGYFFIPGSTPGYATLSASMYNSFEIGDARKDAWTGSLTVDTTTFHYPAKYKVKDNTDITEYYVVFRLAEQILIRAEALAVTGNLSAAIDDLNTIRERAQLPAASITNTDEFNTALMRERRSEFFAEWGHRWLDLKRKNMLDDVMLTVKPTTWASTDALFPIPQIQINNNASFGQNPGY